MNRNLKYIVSVFLLLGACEYVSTDIASEAPSIQDLQKQFADKLPDGLPPLPVNASQLPSEEDAKELLRDKCKRLGGEGAFEKVESAQENFKTCVMSLVNITELQQEMDAAKPTGDLDIVFRKYCRKSPIFSQCINNFTATLEPCLEEREKESKQIVQNITEALLGFLCFKEGDRIALFIAEGGPECLQSKQEQIQHCANTTVSKYMPAQEGATGPLTHIPLLVLDDKECQSIQEFQACVVTSLEECSEPTPANIVESLFQFIVKMTPCKDKKEPVKKRERVEERIEKLQFITTCSSVLIKEPTESEVFGQYIAIKLQNLDSSTQKMLAETLILKTLNQAKLGNLTERTDVIDL